MSTENKPYNGSDDGIRLPSVYKKALAGKEELPQQDFTFIDVLLRQYSVMGETTQPFGRKEFFNAVSDIRNYASILRQQDPPVALPVTISLVAYKEAELAKPSSGRIADIACLFLHIPRVKKIYDAIHVEKMAQALPAFSEQLGTIQLQARATLPDYFERVTATMEDSMVAALEIFPATEIENLGFIMGYNEFGYMRPPEYHRSDVGTIGVGTFTALLEEVINHAVDNESDVAQKITSEFSNSNGIAQRLMTIALRDFNRLQEEEDLFFDEIEDIPKILDTHSFYRGACPALGKIDVVEEGQLIKRKVVDAYARQIVEAI